MQPYVNFVRLLERTADDWHVAGIVTATGLIVGQHHLPPTHHFSPLRGKMAFKTCNSMVEIAMIIITEYTADSLAIVVFRGCGVVVTHQLPKLRMRVRFSPAAFFC